MATMNEDEISAEDPEKLFRVLDVIGQGYVLVYHNQLLFLLCLPVYLNSSTTYYLWLLLQQSKQSRYLSGPTLTPFSFTWLLFFSLL